MNHITRLASRGGLTLLAVSYALNFASAQEPAAKPKQLPAAILKKYDADHDGALNDDEKAAWKADVQKGRMDAQTRRLEKYDANKDGKLDKGEKATAAVDGVKKPKGDGKKAISSETGEELSSGEIDKSSSKMGVAKKGK